MRDKTFIYEMSMGLLPRKFDYSDPDDRVICSEDQEVAELYIVMDGFVGVSFNMNPLHTTLNQNHYYKKQKGCIVILDHYVLNQRKSNFIYVALNETHTFGLKGRFLHKELFPKYKDYEKIMRSESFMYYN